MAVVIYTTMHTRRTFLQQTAMAGAALHFQPFKWLPAHADGMVMTVNGPIKPDAMHFTLTHEHVLADFIGADNYSKDRYNPEEVYAIALPFIKEVKNMGCSTFVDCSPAYLGRDVKLLKRLSDASG